MERKFCLVVSSECFNDIERGYRMKEACRGSLAQFQPFRNEVIITDGMKELIKKVRLTQHYETVALLQEDYEVDDFYRGFLWNKTNCPNGILVFLF